MIQSERKSKFIENELKETNEKEILRKSCKEIFKYSEKFDKENRDSNLYQRDNFFTFKEKTFPSEENNEEENSEENENDDLYKEALVRKKVYTAFSSLQYEFLQLKENQNENLTFFKSQFENQNQLIENFSGLLCKLIENQNRIQEELLEMKDCLKEIKIQKKLKDSPKSIPFFTTTEASPIKRRNSTEKSDSSTFFQNERELKTSKQILAPNSSFQKIDERLNALKKRSLSTNFAKKTFQDERTIIFDRRNELFTSTTSFLKENSFINPQSKNASFTSRAGLTHNNSKSRIFESSSFNSKSLFKKDSKGKENLSKLFSRLEKETKRFKK